MKRAMGIAAMFAAGLLTADCATEGAGTVGAGWYGAYYDYWYDPWYGGGCCVDYPGDIGPIGPHPEHPIVLPPGSDAPRPEQPIAKPDVKPSQPIANRPSATPMSSPRPTSMPRMGGGGRGGRR